MELPSGFQARSCPVEQVLTFGHRVRLALVFVIADLYVPMPATKEEIAAENEFQERLLLAVLDPLTSLPLRDLQHWHFRQSIFTHLDKHIDTVIECSRGRENVARHHLILMLFKIVNRLLGEIDVGQTDAQYEREAMERYEQVAKSASKPEPEPEPRLN